MDRYILDENKKPVPCPDLKEWAKWLENNENKRIAKWEQGGILVSTVFLGLDHNWDMKGPPLLFETMIFGGAEDEYQERCSTYEQALVMHAKAVRRAKQSL